MNNQIEVLITLPFSEEQINSLRSISPNLNITQHATTDPQEISPDEWAEIEILYTDTVLPEIELVPKLKWIQLHRAGIDSLIGSDVLHEDSIATTTLSGAAASQMGEHILMMILALGHKLPELFSLQDQGEWPDDRWERFSPLELRDSTVGIVGYGSVGRHAARLLHEFGATILATKRDVKHPEDKGYSPEGIGDPRSELVRRLYPPEAIQSMLKECDFVVITTPLTEDNRHLFSVDELSAIKPEAYLIDVSRGEIVNHEALIDFLKRGKLAGAALDVYPDEPLPAESPLWELDNVILTPHIAGISKEYDQRAVELFSENLIRYINEQPLYNVFDPQLGY